MDVPQMHATNAGPVRGVRIPLPDEGVAVLVEKASKTSAAGCVDFSEM